MVQHTMLAGHVARCFAILILATVNGQPNPLLRHGSRSYRHSRRCSSILHAWKTAPQTRGQQTRLQQTPASGLTMHLLRTNAG
ncbi:hypothetical protein EYF80_011522 [Liparis tanakae]|uniref:Secreted protein n=1 Tax=Liparis tanakae TaxID=230148 RepID=A0A4Z2IM58_9TELE|nr:hypothetical protein EYF80_011522 [Liparis tanakae]